MNNVIKMIIFDDDDHYDEHYDDDIDINTSKLLSLISCFDMETFVNNKMYNLITLKKIILNDPILLFWNENYSHSDTYTTNKNDSLYSTVYELLKKKNIELMLKLNLNDNKEESITSLRLLVSGDKIKTVLEFILKNKDKSHDNFKKFVLKPFRSKNITGIQNEIQNNTYYYSSFLEFYVLKDILEEYGGVKLINIFETAPNTHDINLSKKEYFFVNFDNNTKKYKYYFTNSGGVVSSGI